MQSIIRLNGKSANHDNSGAVGVGVGVDDRFEKGVGSEFAVDVVLCQLGMVKVCVLLHPLVSPWNTEVPSLKKPERIGSGIKV